MQAEPAHSLFLVSPFLQPCFFPCFFPCFRPCFLQEFLHFSHFFISALGHSLQEPRISILAQGEPALQQQVSQQGLSAEQTPSLQQGQPHEQTHFVSSPAGRQGMPAEGQVAQAGALSPSTAGEGSF